MHQRKESSVHAHQCCLCRVQHQSLINRVIAMLLAQDCPTVFNVNEVEPSTRLRMTVALVHATARRLSGSKLEIEDVAKTWTATSRIKLSQHVDQANDDEMVFMPNQDVQRLPQHRGDGCAARSRCGRYQRWLTPSTVGDHRTRISVCSDLTKLKNRRTTSGSWRQPQTNRAL